jgi:hypothetical protein
MESNGTGSDDGAHTPDPQDQRLPNDDVIGPDLRPRRSRERELGDFTMPVAVLRLVPLAIVIELIGAFVALALLDLIAAITNLAYYQRWSIHLVSPANNHLRGGRHRRPGSRQPGGGADGAVRFGADPRARHPRGHGDHPGRREQG